MAGNAGQGLLKRLRGSGNAVRMLVLALFLQVLAPVLGFAGTAQASPTDSITVCTSHGVDTLVPDGQGGWSQENPDGSGISCAFCLPLLSGHVGPATDVVLPLPPAPTEQKTARVSFAPKAVHADGSSSPRAPPVIR